MSALAELDIACQLALWGYSVTGDGRGIGPRQALRDCHVAALGERRDTEDGWWDMTLAELWQWEVTLPDATRQAPPWRMALAGLR